MRERDCCQCGSPFPVGNDRAKSIKNTKFLFLFLAIYITIVYKSDFDIGKCMERREEYDIELDTTVNHRRIESDIKN